MRAPIRSLVRLAVVALPVVAAACAGQMPRPQVRPPVPGSPSAVVRTAESLLGVPYRAGGADPRGFDCSGFIHYVYARHGISLPRNVRQQWGAGREIARGALRPGDLLFFTTTGPGPTHVTLAVDHDRFIHAPNSRGLVRIESLSSAYWARRFLGARRLTP